MAEVVAHEALDALARLVTGIAEQVGGPLLELVAQHVLIALGLEMQDGTYSQEEVLSLFEPAGIRRTALKQEPIGQRRNRARGHEVAERSRSLLYVGLELIERRIEPGMPLVDQRKQRLEDVGVGAGSVEHDTQPLKQVRGTSHKPRIEQREQKLGIVGFELREFVQLAYLVSDHDADIPERVQKRPEKLLFNRTNPCAKQDQEIDVRVQTQMLAPVPAQRDDRDGQLGATRLVVERPQQDVHPVGVPLQRRTPAGAARGIAAQPLARRFERRTDGGACTGLRRRHAANISG